MHYIIPPPVRQLAGYPGMTTGHTCKQVSPRAGKMKYILSGSLPNKLRVTAIETARIIPNMWRGSNLAYGCRHAASATMNMMKVDVTRLPKLLPGETMVNIQHFPAPPKQKLPSSEAELERLANVTKGIDVGSFGPVLASRSLPHREGKAFRRYEALFGRDSLRVALDLLEKFPKLARNTLLVLAQLQGAMVNDASEEEPGRIVHEVRDPKIDPIAQDFMREHGWQWPYYGSVDATPEYIRLLSKYCRNIPDGADILETEYIGRDGRVHTVAYSLMQAVNWVTARMDDNPEGLIESKRRNPKGIENQVWKDSWDAYFHADGTLVNHKKGVASVEVQRVAYDALLDAADIYEKYLAKKQEAGELRERAKRLKQIILDYFWVDDKGGYFILGTDRDAHGKLRQLKVRTSNMGHLLHSRLLQGDEPDIVGRREQLIAQLFSHHMLSLNGIRTLASDEVRFRPGAYHNGSVWGWDNYIIAQGLDLHGYVGLADYLEQLLIDDIEYAGRFVEFMRGGNDMGYRINDNIIDVWDETYQRINRLEQPPQDMQAWTVAAVLAIRMEREQRQFSRRSEDAAKHQLEHRLLYSMFN